MMVLTLRTPRPGAAVGSGRGRGLCGCVVGAAFGIYDVQRVMDAALDRDSAFLPPGPGSTSRALRHYFWLIPSFSFAAVVVAIETVGDAVAIQRVSWRKPRATDYRRVQGAVAADGIGNLLSGLAGTLPTTTYSTSVAMAEITGVAARRGGHVRRPVYSWCWRSSRRSSP